MRDREQNPAGFIRTTLGEELSAAPPSRSGIMLGIDEGLNNPEYIGALERRLVQDSIVDVSVHLWYQQRRDQDGELFIVGGSSASSLPPNRPIQGASWPDERVVAELVAYFSSYDRLCLLTQNTKNDRNGLRWILTEEVKPAIEDFEPKRLGLLVLANRSSKTGLKGYAAAVEARLRRSGVSLGFSWEEL